MTSTWTVVPVFVCSTFEDMTAERQSLIMRIFPQIQALCKPHRILIEPIDLNWGAIQDPAGHSKILDVVKSELNRSSMMIALLGERFGGVPQGEYDSVCALEIYAALASKTTTLLAFRRKLPFTVRMAEQSGDAVYFETDEGRALEQEKLIKRLEHLGVEMTPYDSMEEFERTLSGGLEQALEAAYLSKHGNVFISYSRADLQKANQLRGLLESSGFNVWLDLVGIAAGDEWPARLADSINQCDVVLMAISNASVSSDYCLKEIIFARKKHKPILGVRLEQLTLPDRIEFMLGDIQQLSVDEAGGLENAMGVIAGGLREQIRRSRGDT